MNVFSYPPRHDEATPGSCHKEHRGGGTAQGRVLKDVSSVKTAFLLLHTEPWQQAVKWKWFARVEHLYLYDFHRKKCCSIKHSMYWLGFDL